MAKHPRLPDEEALLARCRSGDRESFAMLTGHYREWLWRTAAFMLGNEDEAEDVTQEAITRAFADIARFEGRSAFATWLCGIVLNICRKTLRSRARHAGVVDPEHLDENPARHGRRLGVLSTILRREINERMEVAIDRLPIPLREAFLLRYVNGMEYAEIGHAAEITEATARVRAFRARTLLRAELGTVVDTAWIEPDPAT
ncbi:MAG: sigma-70 family RNA polymerase sigma factor [Planctomycetes bacterium]|nr:sigma-70 family RNA polymerase sigma factor [Planctomycetota bacterium]MBI3847066.1 sigma-70 family RNA polymerase sigma factor [Planctomycetota bacterium]